MRILVALVALSLSFSLGVHAKPAPKTEVKRPTHVDAIDALGYAKTKAERAAKQAEYDRDYVLSNMLGARAKVTEREMSTLDVELQTWYELFTKKYGLDTTRDHYNERTYEIQWAPPLPVPPPAPVPSPAPPKK